ncbi:hypothetical protein DFH06DRAFT_1135431 [Mycena polygramma]|nr:hypothetical protein DFH06DRAFT_1135431 [Mycena polygramma]
MPNVATPSTVDPQRNRNQLSMGPRNSLMIFQVLGRYPPARVPPSVAALLADYGLEELGPAFLLLGITSDVKLAAIVASPRPTREFLGRLPGPLEDCSEFQVLMMKFIVERV